MKTKLLTLLAFCYTINAFSQTDDWYLYTKASEITKILPDDVSSDELHLATDIGYIKYNTSTNSVTDYLNLTSQNPAIGKVKDVALDPTSNNIAFTLVDGIGIYDGNTVTVYSYDSSDLTIGELTSQFLYLQVEYAKDGSLYIYKEDALGYQIFNNGVFEVEEATSFRPQDIVENNAGTKAYFASDTNGLWELDKSTDTWGNHTVSNSDLISDFVLSLYVDMNDLLYIGGFQGINTIGSSGVWNSYQELNPINGFPYQVHEISVNETTSDLVVNTSAPSTYFLGLSIVDLSTNTWTNYREDDTNCLNENVYSATAFGRNGKAYAAPIIFSNIPDIGKLVEFTPSTESCTNSNINYLNAPVAVNSNVISDLSIRKKTNGNIDIGFTRTFDFHYTEINPMNFNGVFSAATTLTPSPGNYLRSLVSDNNKFIVENSTGWLIFDESVNISTLTHNLSGYSPIVTKKANVSDSENGIVALLHKGFDAGFNYLVYQTICDIPNATCSIPEQILNNDRDLSQNTSFGGYTKASESGLLVPNLRVLAVSTAEPPTTGKVINGIPHQSSLGSPFLMPVALPGEPKVDPLPLDMPSNAADDFGFFFINDINEAIFITIDAFGDAIATINSFDTNNDGNPDETAGGNSLVITTENSKVIGNGFVTLFTYFGLDLKKSMKSVAVKPNPTNPTEVQTSIISGSELNNKLPNDLSIHKTEIIQTGSTTAMMSMLTNYGLLVKTGINISTLLLDTDDIDTNDNSVFIYPNPSTDLVSFSDEHIASIEVYDLKGRKILNSQGHSISVMTLPRAIYLVKGITIDGVEVIRKLIKN